jgi:2-oxoglutarate dehydrogenase E2 component (dihydrolipoamide succinyltransferase)
MNGATGAAGLPAVTPPVTGAPLASPAPSQPAAPAPAPQPQPVQPAADREPAVVHEPVQRFVELPPEPRPAARPAPRPIVVDDDLDVPDFLK